MLRSKFNLGNHGEEFAVSYLLHFEWQIIEKNFRIRGGEIDSIAIETHSIKKEKTFAFVDVKTRLSQEIGEPLDAIGCYKIRAIIKATLFYKFKHPRLPDLMRIDPVSVLVNEEG